jgi:hypothetical protein
MGETPVTKLRRARWPLACAIAVLFGGYLPLLLFWHLGSYHTGVPGLFEYRSATWGDGLLLPLLAFCLGVLIVSLPGVGRRWPTVLAVIVGAGAGGLVILSWLTDPAHSVNWTMPRPHYLNAPGVWHAVFVVFASALFAGLWIEVLRRLRSASADQVNAWLCSVPAAGAVAGTAGYAWLATVDSARAAGTAAGRGSLVALGLAALLLAASLVWAGRGALRAGLSTALTGLLVATAVIMLADVQWRAGALVYWALLGSLTAGLALASASGRSGDVASHELVAVPALFVVITLLVVVRNDELPVVLLVPIAGVVGSLVLRVVCAGAGWRTRPGLGLEYLAAAGIIPAGRPPGLDEAEEPAA